MAEVLGYASGTLNDGVCNIDEIDFSHAIWTIPAARMKGEVLHRVPLGPRAIDILERQLDKSETGEGLFFPPRSRKPMTDMVLTEFLRDKKIASDTPGRPATIHGFRSSFRDWGYSRDLAERALAHTIKNALDSAYHRTDLLEQRRAMVLEWKNFVLPQNPTG